LFYGWWILILGSLIIAVGSGILYHGFAVFFLPLKRDLAVSSASISLLYGAARLEGGAEGPLVGYLIDRFGPRALMLVGTVLAGVGLILISMVESFWAFFFIYVFIVSLGFNAGFFHPVYAVVNSWFIRHRALGFAATGAASSIGGMVMAPFLAYLILGYGWRTGAVIAGLIMLMLVIPAALPIVRAPEILGLAPDGRSPRADLPRHPGSLTNAGNELTFTVREALKTLDYWLLFFAITLRVTVTVALTIHFVPILVWKGMEEALCAYLVSLFAFATIITTLLNGWVGDRWDKSLLSSAGIIPMVLGMLALMLSQSPLSLYALPLGLAFAMGTVPLNWALIGDLFGRHSYATLRGMIGIGTGLGTFLTPIYAGWVFDRTESYFQVLFTFIIIHLAAACLFILLRARFRKRAVLGQ
jgi:MFS family permease